MPFDVTSIGEIMLRFSVPAGERLEAAPRLEVYPAGAEGNVISALARLGRRCGLVTALPENALGRLAAESLRGAGVDLASVIWQADGRMPTYYVEFSEPPRPIQVIYDRAHSPMTTLKSDMVNWDYLLDTRLVHVTGITPPLAAGCAEVVGELVKRAKAAGVAVSFDVNYRQKLWSPGQAGDALRPMIEGVDLLFCKQADGERLFGVKGTSEECISALAAMTGAKQVVMTVGEGGVFAWDNGDILHQSAVPTKIIDRLGAGDALAAGVLHGWLAGDLKRGLQYGVVMAALALTQYGDMVITTQNELENLTAVSGSGDRLVR